MDGFLECGSFVLRSAIEERAEKKDREIERLQTKCDHQSHRIAQLEKVINRQQFIEDRYEELMLSARRCWRYYGADQELFNASMKAMDFLIRRHATEIDEMNDEGDDEPSNA